MFHRFNILNEVYFYLKEEGSFNMDIKEVAKKYANVNSAKKAVSKSLWSKQKYKILDYDNYTSP